MNLAFNKVPWTCHRLIKNEKLEKNHVAQTEPITNAIQGIRTEPSELILRKQEISHYDLFCELTTSSLIIGIQTGEITKLGWLIGLF
jgi:hypothetical protein